MEKKIYQDETGTHIEWSLDGVSANQLDWFWSNMEKCDHLWHPNQHNGFSWMISPVEKQSMVDTIHIAPQTWGNGIAMNIYIRCEALENVPEKVRKYIRYNHAIIVAGISLDGKDVHADDPALGYRLHQWQASDNGVVGMSSAIEMTENDAGDGKIWAEHAAEEVGNWEVFLPTLWKLYQVIERKDICPFFSLEVEGSGVDAKYKAQ
jgi:hypothetical protein